MMVVAMMVPPGLPMLRYVALSSLWRRRYRAPTLFLLPVLGLFLMYVYVISLVPLSLTVALLAAAGWELTVVKRRLLRASHRTTPLPPSGLAADVACLRFGLTYGCTSLGCGWALMLPMVVAGRWMLPLMVLNTAVMVASEYLRQPAPVLRASSVALLAVALVVSV
jgi:predicted metal-binding membrane protein